VTRQAEKKEQHKYKENNPRDSGCRGSYAEKLEPHRDQRNDKKCQRHSQHDDLLNRDLLQPSRQWFMSPPRCLFALITFVDLAHHPCAPVFEIVPYPTNSDKSNFSSALMQGAGELRYTPAGAYEFLLEQL
jgi:hypothetical protein